jgi:plastocyanin
MWVEMARRSILALASLLLLTLSAIAAPLVAQAGGGCHGPVSPPGDGPASVIKIDGCQFFPTVVRVPVGTTVRFLNTGDVDHNVAGVGGTWGTAQLAVLGEYRRTFDAPGVYPFACTFHPGMNGAVVVGGGAAPAVDLAVASQPADAQPSGPDATSLAIAGLVGLGIGIALGVGVARVRAMRARTTG